MYLRCVRPTDTEYAWVEEEEDSEDDGIDEVDEGERGLDDLPESGLGGGSHTVSTPVTAHSANVVQVDDNVTSRSNTLNGVRNTDILQYFSTPASSTSNQSLVGSV